MDEVLKWIFTFVAALVVNFALMYVAMRNSRNSDSKTMVELQQLAQAAVVAQKEAVKARDEAVSALEEYKLMRVADFEITILFSLHPVPIIKDVAIRSVIDNDHDKTKPLKITKRLATK